MNSSDKKHIIRFASDCELSRIQQIEVESGILFINTDYAYISKDNPLPLDFLSEQQHNNLIWVICHNDNEPVGFAVVILIDNQPHLHQISVVSQYGNKGLGTTLINEICTWAIANNYRVLTLSTFTRIPWNAPFYHKLGFNILDNDELSKGLQIIREKEKAAGLPIEDRVIMRKILLS